VTGTQKKWGLWLIPTTQPCQAKAILLGVGNEMKSSEKLWCGN
jgi:hypothetical protein